VKRNRFVRLAGGKKSVNRELVAKARGVAGPNAYITNINNPSPNIGIADLPTTGASRSRNT